MDRRPRLFHTTVIIIHMTRAVDHHDQPELGFVVLFWVKGRFFCFSLVGWFLVWFGRARFFADDVI